MKVEDSGMPEEQYWNSLFDVSAIIDWLNLSAVAGPIVEIGCGYGTFTVPVARSTTRGVWALDIDKEMVVRAESNVHEAECKNVIFFQRDVLEAGTGLPESCAGMVLLFNILHFPERRVLLQEASRILVEGGEIAIIHWRKDIATPRGPRVDLRPDRSMIKESVVGLDLLFSGKRRMLGPYHWGIKLKKGSHHEDRHHH